MSRAWVRHLAVVVRSIPAVRRKLGILRTLQLAWQELLFDMWNGTETSIEFTSESSPSRGTHPVHTGSNPLIFTELMAHVAVEKGRSVLLDLGAGKGRALLLAARHGFHKAIGVELSSALCQIAEKNIATYGKCHPGSLIEVHCADAATFEIPLDVNVIFLYNPFGPQVIHAVIDHIVASVARRPRPLYVVYLHPRFDNLFIRAGFALVYRQGMDGLILRYTCQDVDRPPRRVPPGPGFPDARAACEAYNRHRKS